MESPFFENPETDQYKKSQKWKYAGESGVESKLHH